MSKCKMVRLGDILQYEQPTKYIVENTNYNHNYKTPVLTAGQTFILGYTNETNNIYKKNLPCIIFDDFTTAIKLVDFPFKVKSSAMKILNNDKNLTDIRFLYYFMTTVKMDIELHKRYWISEFANIDIQLPELAIQKKIADTLEKLVYLTSLHKQQIKKFNLLVKSRFIEMFGDLFCKDEKYPKRQIATVIGDNIARVGRTYNLSDKIKYIDITSIDNRCNEIVKYVEYIVENAPSRAQQIVQMGDVLVSTVRPNLKNVAVVRDSFDNMVASTGFCVLRPMELINTEYLFEIVNSDAFAEYLIKMAKGASYPAVNGSDIKDFEIAIPPISLQNSFADFVKQVDKSKFVMQKGLEKLELTYKALMQQYFG